MNESNVRNRRILVVDDNRAIHEDFRKILCPAASRAAALEAVESALFDSPAGPRGRIPFEVDSAYQGQEGLALASRALERGQPYAVAFLDVRMPPGWDGIETSVRLWEICPDLQIVICTAYADYSWDQMVSRLNNSEQLVILKKPFDAIEVLQLANSLSEKWQLHQQVRLKVEELEGLVAQRTAVLRDTNAALQLEVAERQRAAEALRESDERYQLLFRKSPFPMWVFDRETLRFLAVNETAVRNYGYSQEEFLALSIEEIRPPSELPQLRECLASLETRKAGLLVAKHRKKDGTVIDVEIATNPIEFTGRRAVLVLAHDITDKKKLETQFLRAQRMEGIGTLATGMAHDLNNILAPILMSAGILRWQLTEEEREIAISRIELSVKRGAGIIQQVLTFGRGVGGERVPIHPGHLLQEVANLIGQTFPKDVVLHIETQPGLWPILGDKTQLHQVLLNLCINARDAMPRGGRLTLRGSNLILEESSAATQSGPHLLLQVSDTGCGIPSADIERIFDPFFTTKELGKGTGLGLSTVVGIIRSHHGRITVESQPGQGTTFKIFLPVSTTAAGPAAAAVVAAAPRGRGETVLIVDDETNIVDATRETLEKHGYKILGARGSEEALALFDAHAGAVRAVVTDLMMPGMDGLALIRALRVKAPQTSIIASSGLGADQGGASRAAEVKSLGVKTFLAKPYGAEDLLVALGRELAAAVPATNGNGASQNGAAELKSAFGQG